MEVSTQAGQAPDLADSLESCSKLFKKQSFADIAENRYY